MNIQATVNGMTVEQSCENLPDFVDFVENVLDLEVSDIENIQRIDC